MAGPGRPPTNPSRVAASDPAHPIVRDIHPVSAESPSLQIENLPSIEWACRSTFPSSEFALTRPHPLTKTKQRIRPNFLPLPVESVCALRDCLIASKPNTQVVAQGAGHGSVSDRVERFTYKATGFAEAGYSLYISTKLRAMSEPATTQALRLASRLISVAFKSVLMVL